jgi:RNA polymerase sigma factor (sigma-70 family)
MLLKTQSDTRLVELVRGGHERAFAEIVARYRPPIERYCGRLMPGSMADDAVQQTFVSAWSALTAGTPVRELRPWIYRIARNAVLRTLERDRVDADELPESLQGGASPPHQLELRDTMRRTVAALGQLPEQQRVALVGIALEGRSRQELARELDVSEGAVRQLVHRARCSVRSVAGAFIPLPLLQRVLTHDGPGGEAGAVAGSAAAGGLLAKLGVAATATAILAGGPTLVQVARGGGSAEARTAAVAPPDAATTAGGLATLVDAFAPLMRPGRSPAADTGPARRHRVRAATGQAPTGDAAAPDAAAVAAAASADDAAPPQDPSADDAAVDTSDTTASDAVPADDAPADATPADTVAEPDPAADPPADPPPAP